MKEKFWKSVTGLIAEKTGETRGQVLERIADRSTRTPSSFAKLVAKSRT